MAEPRKQPADGQHKIKGSLSEPANRDADHGSSENGKSKLAVHPAGSKTANDPAASCATNRDRTAIRESCSLQSRASTSNAEKHAFDSGAEGKGTSRLAEHNTTECRAPTGSCARSKKSCGPASDQDTTDGTGGTANGEGSRQSKRASAACHFSSGTQPLCGPSSGRHGHAIHPSSHLSVRSSGRVALRHRLCQRGRESGSDLTFCYRYTERRVF